MKKVIYTQTRIRYWWCIECDFENKTEISPEGGTPPVCENCGHEFEWGDEEI